MYGEWSRDINDGDATPRKYRREWSLRNMILREGERRRKRRTRAKSARALWSEPAHLPFSGINLVCKATDISINRRENIVHRRRETRARRGGEEGGEVFLTFPTFPPNQSFDRVHRARFSVINRLSLSSRRGATEEYFPRREIFSGGKIAICPAGEIAADYKRRPAAWWRKQMEEGKKETKR